MQFPWGKMLRETTVAMLLPQWLKRKSSLFFGGICHCLMGLEPEECASCGTVLGFVVDCVCWIMGMFVQFGLWPFLDRLGIVELEKTVGQIHKKTHLNKSCKDSTEDLPLLLFGTRFPWKRSSWCHWGGGKVHRAGLVSHSDAVSEPEDKHVHVSVCAWHVQGLCCDHRNYSLAR